MFRLILIIILKKTDMNHNYPKYKIEDLPCPNHPNSIQEIAESKDDVYSNEMMLCFPNEQEIKKFNFDKLYKKLNLQSLGNKEENIKYINEQFFGKNNNLLMKQIKEEETKPFTKNEHMGLSKKDKTENYLTKFCKTDKQEMIKASFPCQFCYQHKLSNFPFINMNNKYKTTIESYNVKVINDIIYNENTNIVSIFKDYLIYDDTSEFLKRFYNCNESKPRLPKIFGFYTTHSTFFPSTINLSEGKIIHKHKKKHKSHNDEIQEEENRKHPKRVSKNLFGDDDKIFTTRFLEELNRPESGDEMHSIDLSNSIINLYYKGLKSSSKKNMDLPLKEENTLNHLLKQIEQENSNMFNTIADKTKFNNSIEKKNEDMIKEIEKNKEKEGVYSNALKRNNTLKNEFRLSKPSSTSKDSKVSPNKNLKSSLKPSNIQTKSSREETNIDKSKKNTLANKELLELLLSPKKIATKNLNEEKVNQGFKDLRLEQIKSNELKKTEANPKSKIFPSNLISTKVTKNDIKHNIPLKLNENISKKITNS